MKTKAEIIAKLKTEYPTLREGDDERGYVDFSPAEYEATIDKWAEITYQDLMAEAAKKAAEAKAVTDKAALLAKLGITADEAKLLLS